MLDTSEIDSASRRNFRLVLAVNTISTFGSSIFNVLLLWMAIALTGSPLITGIVSSMLVVPLIFNFAVGAAIDNYGNKRFLAISASVMRIIASSILVTVLIFRELSIEEAVLMISALAFGLTKDIFAPVNLIWSKMYLRKPAYLKGMSVMNMAFRGARLSGYFAAGIIVTASLYYSTIVASAAYFASMIPILLLPARIERPSPRKDSLLDGIKEGFSYIRRTRLVFDVIMIFMLAGFFTGMTDSTFAVEVRNILKLNAAFLSYIFLLSSAGGIFGSAISSRFKGTIGLRFSGIYLLYGLVFLFMGIFPGVYAFLAMMFLAGLISGVASPMIISIILGKVPKEKMGRIQGVMDTFGFSFNSASGILAGLIMGVFLPRVVFYVVAAGLISLSVASSRFRELRSTEL